MSRLVPEGVRVAMCYYESIFSPQELKFNDDLFFEMARHVWE